MSKLFPRYARSQHDVVRDVYNADAVAIVPVVEPCDGGAVARQFGGAHAMIVRNGWFSHRWSQIFDAGDFAAQTTVHSAPDRK
jgi:ketosteroid isomerase-like protein